MVVHEKYKPSGKIQNESDIRSSFSSDSRQLYDIALARMEEPINTDVWNLGKENGKATVCPLCLPDSKLQDIGLISFVIGYGLIFHLSCHTGGAGPVQYTQCASGAVQTEEGKPDWSTPHWSRNKEAGAGSRINWYPGCKNGYPPLRVDTACRNFNHNKKYQNHVGKSL